LNNAKMYGPGNCGVTGGSWCNFIYENPFNPMNTLSGTIVVG